MPVHRLLFTLLAAMLALPGAETAVPPPPDKPASPTEVTRRNFQPISKGKRWLIAAQNRNGSWGLDAKTPAEISCTIVAAMSLMAAGNTERGGPEPKCVDAVRRALDYVLKRAEKMKGTLMSDPGGQLTLVQHKLGHHIHTFFATVFLSHVYGMRAGWVRPDQVETLREYVTVMVERTITSQEPDGSWHKNTFGSLKATCMAWLALRAASSVGLDVEDASVDKTIRFIKAQWNSGTKLFDQTSGRGGYQSIYATASCLRVLYAVGEGGSPEASSATDAFMKFVRSGAMGRQFLTVEGEDYLSAALVTQALLMVDDRARWAAWFPWISGELVRRQQKDGSWTTTACISGKTFATACALLTLQAPYRLLPLNEL